MVEIKVFVAGAKELSLQRQRITALINDLNVVNSRRSRGVRFTLSSYENFGDNQDEYNAFIQNDADIVLFLIEDRLGTKTQEELLLASRCYSTAKRPEILVFLKNFTEETKEVARIQGIITGAVHNYYSVYDSLDSLAIQVRLRLDEYVDEKYPIRENGTFLARLQHSPKYLYQCLSAILLLLILCMSYVIWNPERTLLFVGGGSAANFMKLYKSIDVRSYYNSIYADMPTGNAWFVLEEEVMLSLDHMHFVPLCLSASKAKDDDFLSSFRNAEAFIKYGNVISYKLGDDTLKLYMSEQFYGILLNSQRIRSGKVITTVELSSILEHASELNLNIFTTTHNSGTRKTYNEKLEPHGCFLDSIETEDFREKTDISRIERKNSHYIVMGSGAYTADALRLKTDLKAIPLVDTLGVPVTKEVFLYFLGYKKDTDDQFLRIPKETEKFLIKVGLPVKEKIHNGQVYRNSSGVIIPFEDLVDVTRWSVKDGR